MQPLDLKNQSRFLTQLPQQTKTLASSTLTTSLTPSQIVSPTQIVDKASNTIEHASRIYSPYLTPSAVHAESRQLAQGGMTPLYQHNIAATKYFNVSVTPKFRPHSNLNLMA